MPFSKIVKNYIGWIGDIVFFLAKRAFSVILALIAFNMCLGLFLFFKYVIFSSTPQDNGNVSLEFKEDVYQTVIKERQDILDFSSHYAPKEYQSPFLSVPPKKQTQAQ